MRFTGKGKGRIVSLVLALVLTLPVFGGSVAAAADVKFVGGPDVGYAPTVVPNDHTPLAVRFSGSSLEASTTYYVKVRLTLNPDPATGGGGAAHRGFVWNPTTGKWVRNRGAAWTDYPTIQTDGSGNVISTNDANWVFFKFGNETNKGDYYLNITLNTGVATEGGSHNSDTPLLVKVVDMKTEGSWVHNSAASGETDFKRATLNSFDTTASTNKVLSIGRTELNNIDDDSNEVVDDEDLGVVGKMGDYRLAASAETTVDVYLRQSRKFNDFVMPKADEDIALGAADQSAPTSPTALSAECNANGTVSLSWAASTDASGVTQYNVYRWVDVNSVEYTPAHVLVGTTATTSFVDSTVEQGVTYNYEVRAADAATNVSARSTSAAVYVDSIAPTAALSTPNISTAQSATRTFNVSWAGSDPSPGSGVDEYDVDYKVGAGGTWIRYRTGTEATKVAFSGGAGRTYYFRVRAIDEMGNVGAWSASDSTVVPYDNTSFKYSSGWKKVTSGSYYGGSAKRTKSWSSASMTFTGGTSANLIASTRPNRGKVRVYRDGKYLKTISLRSSTTQYRRSIYLCSLKGSGKHTIKLVAVPVSGRRYVDVDGLAIKR